MVSILDIAIIALSTITLILIIRNIIVYEYNYLNNIGYIKKILHVNKNDSVDNDKCFGSYIALYKSTGLPSHADVSRIKAIIRSSRLSVSVINNLRHVPKSRLIKYLEREIDRMELAYSTTGHVKYAERLRFLEDLYKLVNSMHVSYVGGISLIVWDEGGSRGDIPSETESLVKLIEAETGLSFKRIDSFKELFSVEPRPENLDSGGDLVVVDPGQFDKPGVIAGFLDDEYIEPVILGWPHDFEAHIGVFGPTGRGKTVLLAGIAAQLGIRAENRSDPYMTLVIDPKGDLTRILSSIRPNTVSIRDCVMVPSTSGEASLLINSSTSAGAGSSIRVCEGTLLRRGFWILDLSPLKPEDRSVAASLALSSILVEALEHGLPGRVVIVIDEAWRLARGRGLHLEMALREGRSRGVHIVYATQSPADVPNGVLDNTRVVFAFSGYSSSYSEEISKLGFEPSMLSSMPVGSALLRIGHLGPYRLRIPDFRKLLKTPYYS